MAPAERLRVLRVVSENPRLDPASRRVLAEIAADLEAEQFAAQLGDILGSTFTVGASMTGMVVGETPAGAGVVVVAPEES